MPPWGGTNTMPHLLIYPGLYCKVLEQSCFPSDLLCGIPHPNSQQHTTWSYGSADTAWTRRQSCLMYHHHWTVHHGMELWSEMWMGYLLEHNYQRTNTLNDNHRLTSEKRGKGNSLYWLGHHTGRWRLQENKTGVTGRYTSLYILTAIYKMSNS